MGKLNFCRYLISRFYPTREIRENLMHTKNMCFTVHQWWQFGVVGNMLGLLVHHYGTPYNN